MRRGGPVVELLKQHTVERAIEIFESALAAVRAET